MFFSQALLWRKGPVANIWTAAYFFKKLKREQIAQTDIASSVDQMININQNEISCRILAHLLVGIVRIFSKKVEWLEEDCNKTLKILMESFQAIYWTNRKKPKHGRKQATHVPESSAGGTHTEMNLIEALRAHSNEVVISVPARFELDLFDLEITDDCDAPDRHQQSAHNDKTLDESNSTFFRKTYLKDSGCRIFYSTCFTTIEDVIPANMMTDLDLDITDLYDSDSGKRENNLNPNTKASAEQHEESIQNLHSEVPIVEADAVDITGLYDSSSGKDNTSNPNAHELAEQHEESIQNLHTEYLILDGYAVEPSLGCCESPLRDIIPDANASADRCQESAQNLPTKGTSGEVEPVVTSSTCHGSPLKDINVSSKEKEDVPILKYMRRKRPLNLADVPTSDEGLLSPKLMVQTPAKRERGVFSPKRMVRTPAKRDISRNLRKRKVSWCCDQEIVLSNEVMRNAINDPSDLVYERRKPHRTCLVAWRVERFNSVDQLFTEPLIPCIFSKACAGTSDHTPHRPNDCNNELEKTLNTPCENLTDVSNVGASNLEQSTVHHIESEVQESETVEKTVDASGNGSSRFEKIRRRLFEPGTPDSGPHRRSSNLSDWINERSEDPSGFGSLPDGPTPRILTGTSDTSVSSLDSELGYDDGNGDVDQIKEDTVWSVRTRYVAHHLHKKISDLKRLNQESCLSLEQMLQGKKRKSCARFFYETLMLKGRGMIDLKQELPYGDIKISATPQLDEELRDS